MKPRTITILGGGLAGLTLGIALRQRHVPVKLWEAGRYPRHRVCGEFISGGGQQTLSRLGLHDVLRRAGAVPAMSVAFFAGAIATIPRRLPSSAICISRYDLDRALADEFVEAGGELHLGRRLSCHVGEGMVRATGRRLEREGEASGWWGLKIHARHVPMISDLEMHVSASGYVGLCRLAGGVVNVCGLFRRASASDGHRNASRVSRDDLRGCFGGAGDGVLVERLAAAEFDETSYCAVAGLSLRPHRAVSRQELCIGDAVTMIPPVTGNGMSMALESAELAVEPLVGWARGETDWWRARGAVAARCDRAFSGRLAWAKWLQPLLFSPVFRPALLCLGARSDRLWRLLFDRTR